MEKIVSEAGNSIITALIAEVIFMCGNPKSKSS